jgi:hypothetical protein
MGCSPLPGKVGSMIEHGPFSIAPDGALSLRDSGRAPLMRFRWKGHACEARLEADGLRFRALAGRIPSTAEPGADRTRTFAAVAALPAALPRGWRLRLTADHRLRVEADGPVASSAPALLGALVRFALALDPYLDAVEAVGAGTAKT